MIFTEKLSCRLFTLKLFVFLLFTNSFLTGCSNTTHTSFVKPSSKELYLVSHPSKETLHKINKLIPSAMKWYDHVDKTLYKIGRVLTKKEKALAKQLGVRNPNAVRVVSLDKFPEPDGHVANNSHSEGARAMGNIIMIKPHLKNDSEVLCHELVHIAQKDRMGLHAFLKQMALEKHILGYSKSSLENEAYALQQTLL